MSGNANGTRLLVDPRFVRPTQVAKRGFSRIFFPRTASNWHCSPVQIEWCFSSQPVLVVCASKLLCARQCPTMRRCLSDLEARCRASASCPVSGCPTVCCGVSWSATWAARPTCRPSFAESVAARSTASRGSRAALFCSPPGVPSSACPGTALPNSTRALCMLIGRCRAWIEDDPHLRPRRGAQAARWYASGGERRRG